MKSAKDLYRPALELDVASMTGKLSNLIGKLSKSYLLAGVSGEGVREKVREK